jgi:hypothetical protein
VFTPEPFNANVSAMQLEAFSAVIYKSNCLISPTRVGFPAFALLKHVTINYHKITNSSKYTALKTSALEPKISYKSLFTGSWNN